MSELKKKKTFGNHPGYKCRKRKRGGMSSPEWGGSSSLFSWLDKTEKYERERTRVPRGTRARKEELMEEKISLKNTLSSRGRELLQSKGDDLVMEAPCFGETLAATLCLPVALGHGEKPGEKRGRKRGLVRRTPRSGLSESDENSSTREVVLSQLEKKIQGGIGNGMQDLCRAHSLI